MSVFLQLTKTVEPGDGAMIYFRQEIYSPGDREKVKV